MSSMWDDALFRVRAARVDFWPLLGSWQLSVALMVTAAFWSLLLAVFAFLSPPHVVRALASLGMWTLLYALLLINTAACVVMRRVTASALFHAALFLIAGGFLLTASTREETTVRVAEGEASERFAVEKIEPQLWRDELLFTKLEATLAGGRTTRINRPLLLGPATFLRLTGFGFAPRYEIIDRRGNTIEGAFVKVAIFPPGQRDFIATESLPFRIYVTTSDLRARTLDVQVFRGRLLVAQGRVGRNDALDVEGLRLRFPEVRYWGDFAIVRDAGAPLIFLGILLALVALAWRLR